MIEVKHHEIISTGHAYHIKRNFKQTSPETVSCVWGSNSEKVCNRKTLDKKRKKEDANKEKEEMIKNRVKMEKMIEKT